MQNFHRFVAASKLFLASSSTKKGVVRISINELIEINIVRKKHART